MTLITLLNPFLYSLVPGAIAIGVGCSLGYMAALCLNRWAISLPGFLKQSVLLPWRTIMLGMFYLISPGFLVWILHLRFGDQVQIATTFLSILIVALPFSLASFMEEWHPIPYRVKLFSLARTLVCCSLIIGVEIPLGGMRQASYLGFVISENQTLGRMSEATGLWLSVVVLVLAVDMIFGLVQYKVWKRTS